MLSKAERAGKLTTAQRFLNNAAVQAAIGIDRTLPLELGRTRPRDQFNQVLRTFVRDLVEGKNVTSRMNAPQIVPYANSLAAQPGLSPHRISREPLSAGASSTQPQRRRSAPPKLETVAKVRHEPEITKALGDLDNFKLKALYYSICTIELGTHTPLVSVGVWSFFETLTALMGRGTDVSFDSFLSKVRLTGLGLSGVKSFGPVLARLNQVGNETKHHATAANFNNLQLDNDMTTLKPVVLVCIAELRKSI